MAEVKRWDGICTKGAFGVSREWSWVDLGVMLLRSGNFLVENTIYD